MDQSALGRRGADRRNVGDGGLGEFMQHRGVQFSIREALAGEWRYSFKIDDKIISGKTQTRLQLLAVRRVKDRINRELNRGTETES
ncbi:hypothetical protein ABIB82_004952 [Bradyrhizobium sp. i1.8.4]|uniref:hypothetical protein n=1 Tax=unclassified Bradyrhizobium TaxID=2631580 RepID=UPI003D25F103